MKLSFLKNSSLWILTCLLPLLASCAGTSTAPATLSQAVAAPTENHLRVGDELLIRLTTGGRTQQNVTPADSVPVTIDEEGQISLPLIGRIPAAGMTPGELGERIEANYVPRFYVRCSAAVQVQARFFYVGGEVRAPSRYPWTEDMTLLKAINTAGSFTDYANRRRVEIVRGKEKLPVDMDQIRQDPSRDVAIRPGDSIWVPRSIF